jgi:very-short-patch-repair endonuclease
MIKICKVCKKSFETNKDGKKYCSATCYHSTLKGSGNPMSGVDRKGKCYWMSETNKRRKGIKLPPRSEESKKRNSISIKEWYSTHENPRKLKFDNEKIAISYLEGKSIPEIAKIFNCTANPIRKALINKGIKIRTSGETQSNKIFCNNEWIVIPKDKLEFLKNNYSENTTLWLSKKLELTEGQIGNIATKYGLKKSSEHRKEIGKIKGKETYARGLGIAGISKEDRIRTGKIAYSKGLGKLSKERLRDISKSGAKAMYEKLVKENRVGEVRERMRKVSLDHFDKLKKEGKFLEFQHEANKQIPQRNTSIEIALEKELIRRNFNVIEMEEFVNNPKFKEDKNIVVKQYKFEDRFWIDFALPNRKMAVECWGEFHHVHPDLYDRNNLKYSQQKKHVKSDEIRLDYIKKKGWKVLTFWGKELIKNSQRCVDAIEEQLQDKSTLL